MRFLMRFLLVILMAMPLFIFPPQGKAQDLTEIVYGETVQGEISDETPVAEFAFEGVEGDTITITLTSTGEFPLDSYLELYDPTGSYLISDDDSAGNLNARIGPQILNSTGRYTLRAMRCCSEDAAEFNPFGDAVATFELTLDKIEIPQIAHGETASIELATENNYAYFQYKSTGNEVGRIGSIVINGDDAYSIQLRDNSGFFVDQSYGVVGSPALVDPAFFKQAGVYIIVVQLDLYAAAEKTDVAVEVELFIESVATQPLTLGQTVNGTLDDETPSLHYRFQGQRNDLLNLSGENAEGTEPFEVVIYSPQGYVINSINTFQFFEQRQFLLDPLQLTEDGEYLFVLRRIQSGESGLEGTISEFRFSLNPSRIEIIEADTEIEGEISGQSANNEVVYRYEGVKDEKILVTLRSLNANYAPALSLQAPVTNQGYNKSQLFYATAITPSTITFTVELPADGTYLFRVSNGRFNGETGRYGLLVERQ